MFLDAMYSAHRFGHKQIFATFGMKALYKAVCLELLELRKFHELSFPYSFYLRVFKSDVVVGITLPVVKAALSVFPVRNKMLVVGRRK